MPRAFLITNKRYESTSSTFSSILDQKKQVLVHSKENNHEKNEPSEELVIGSEAESNLKPSSPGSPARLHNRISVLSHTALIENQNHCLNLSYKKQHFDKRCFQFESSTSASAYHCPTKIVNTEICQEFEDQAQDLTLHHLRSFSVQEETESIISSCSSNGSSFKHSSEQLMLSDDIHICPDCGKRYSTSSNLARHRQTHRSVTDKKARKCPHCDKVYVSMPAYSMHVRTHTQGCVCSYCGKCFSRPWLLQGHIRTHTGEKPFKCPICAKAFADKSNLRAHVQTHSTTKPYVCQRCGKAFALKSYLYKHEESSCMRMHRPALTSTSTSGSNQHRSVSLFMDNNSSHIN